jgi:hypothetical protein
MYTLSNPHLQVSLLDPVADRQHFGPRYCTGGYIYQITDTRHGPLLSGPEYPGPFGWFNGQGLPDAFNLQPLREPNNPIVLILGIGLCEVDKGEVIEFCSWEVEATETYIRFTTRQAAYGFSVELERVVSLSNRTVRSFTRVHNTSDQRFIPLSWFPHPFFPQVETPELFRCNAPIRMPENPGYALATNGYILQKEPGHFQSLDHEATAPLVIIQKHPVLGLVTGTCSYIPALFPIWGNRHTFSWEPFFERTLAFNQAAEWWIDYDF